MIYEHYTIGGELYHHGILGQKWGDRNGPPYPLGSGDHSAKEKKAGWKKSLDGGEKKTSKVNYRKNYKRVAKQAKKLKKDWETVKVDDDIKDSVSEDKLKRLKDARDKLWEAFDEEDKFTKSKEYHEYQDKVYDETYKWFEENEPEYLKEIIKNNGGSKEGLDAFHDFRKLFEGNEDYYYKDALEKYKKRRGDKYIDYDTADKEYEKAGEEVLKDLFGKYANDKKIKGKIDINNLLEKIDENRR